MGTYAIYAIDKYACSSKCTGLDVSVLLGQPCRRNSVWFGRDHIFRKACSVASIIIVEIVQLLRKRQIIQENNYYWKKTKENIYQVYIVDYGVTVWSEQPLNGPQKESKKLKKSAYML